MTSSSKLALTPLAAVVLAAFALGACSDLSTAPVDPQFSLDNPVFVQTNPSGIQVCVDNEGSEGAWNPPYDLASGKFDDGYGTSVEVTAPEGYLVAAYCVKSSTSIDFVVVDPPTASVTILTPSPGQDISHYVVYFVLADVPDMGQWCSPGYWRQTHHLDSWEATGYDPDDKFFAALGYYPTRSPQGVANNATTDPTLWQVLQSPQWYGGHAFNAVGDLLSAAHPDVNFDGNRVEDSCPLN